jgi:hypothetical protein
MAAFMNNFVGDGNGYVGNLDLDPEVARTISLTADWHDANEDRWGLRVTPYYTDVQDYIDAVQWNAATNLARTPAVTNAYTVLRYTNQSARLYGVDLSGLRVFFPPERVLDADTFAKINAMGFDFTLVDQMVHLRRWFGREAALGQDGFRINRMHNIGTFAINDHVSTVRFDVHDKGAALALRRWGGWLAVLGFLNREAEAFEQPPRRLAVQAALIDHQAVRALATFQRGTHLSPPIVSTRSTSRRISNCPSPWCTPRDTSRQSGSSVGVFASRSAAGSGTTSPPHRRAGHRVPRHARPRRSSVVRPPAAPAGRAAGGDRLP